MEVDKAQPAAAASAPNPKKQKDAKKEKAEKEAAERDAKAREARLDPTQPAGAVAEQPSDAVDRAVDDRRLVGVAPGRPARDVADTLAANTRYPGREIIRHRLRASYPAAGHAR